MASSEPVVIEISSGSSFILVQAQELHDALGGDANGNQITEIRFEDVVTTTEDVTEGTEGSQETFEEENASPVLTRQGAEDKSFKHHVCLVCNKEFTNASNLYRHLRKVHKTEAPKQPTSHPICLCPLCDQDNPSRTAYLKHLEEVHDIHCRRESHLFQDWNTFVEWKKNVEIKSKTDFIHSTASKRPNKNYTYYVCSRSGYYTSRQKEDQRQRKIKSLGSRKIGGCCPAQIRVLTKPDNFIEVDYCRTHVGHRLDEQHLIIPDDIKAFVVSLLEAKTPTSQILEEVKGRFERCELVTRKAIANIAAKNGLKLTKASFGVKTGEKRAKKQAAATDGSSSPAKLPGVRSSRRLNTKNQE